MCGCFWLIKILSFVEEVKQGGAKKGGKEDKIASKKEEKKDKEGKKSRGTPGKVVGVEMRGGGDSVPLSVGDSVIHAEVVYPEFELISNPSERGSAAGRCILKQYEQCPDLYPFFPWSIPD